MWCSMKKSMKQGPGRDSQDTYRSRYILTYIWEYVRRGERMHIVSTCVFSTFYTHNTARNASTAHLQASIHPLSHGFTLSHAGPAVYVVPLRALIRITQAYFRKSPPVIQGALVGSRPALSFSFDLSLAATSSALSGRTTRLVHHTSCNNPRALRMPCLFTSSCQAIPDSSLYLTALFGTKGDGKSLLLVLFKTSS